VGSVVNVLLIRKFVFSEKRFELKTDLQWSLLSYTLVFSAGMGVLWVLVGIAAMNPYYAKLATSILTFCINYGVRMIIF